MVRGVRSVKTSGIPRCKRKRLGDGLFWKSPQNSRKNPYDKGPNLRSYVQQSHILQRFKGHVAMLSNEVQLIQKSKEQAVSTREKRFHTENGSLRSDYEIAVLK